MGLVIKNGNVVAENEVLQADVLIEDGLIVQIGKNLSGDEIIDASNKFVLPGGIDVHTHLNLDVGIAVAQDDFYTGTVAAACGGTTTIVDHIAFGPKGCPLEHQISHYHKLAKDKAVIDYSFHGVIQHVNDDVLKKMETLIDEGITSYKIYMTYDYKLDDKDIYKVLKRAKELGIIIAVHPENHDIVTTRRSDLIKDGKTSAKYHPLSRPENCEAEAINRIMQISAMAGNANLYIVHLTNHLGMKYIMMGRENGIKNLFVETCPQYLMLDESCYDRNDGLKYVLSPPLRAKENNNLLWEDIIKNKIDIIGTDHCPFDYKLKTAMGKDDFTKCPNGIPGIETRIPIMFSEGVQKGRITLNQFADISSANPAKLFGMYPKKGVIRNGSDADIVIIDPEKPSIIKHENLHENVDYTPYEGIELLCSIDCVISRGEVIVKENEFIGEKSRGEFIKRNKPILI